MINGTSLDFEKTMYSVPLSGVDLGLWKRGVGAKNVVRPTSRSLNDSRGCTPPEIKKKMLYGIRCDFQAYGAVISIFCLLSKNSGGGGCPL